MSDGHKRNIKVYVEHRLCALNATTIHSHAFLALPALMTACMRASFHRSLSPASSRLRVIYLVHFAVWSRRGGGGGSCRGLLGGVLLTFSLSTVCIESYQLQLRPCRFSTSPTTILLHLQAPQLAVATQH